MVPLAVPFSAFPKTNGVHLVSKQTKAASTGNSNHNLSKEKAMKSTPKATGRSESILTVEDVASMLRVAKRTVWRLVSTGKIPQPIRYGRNVRWRSADIDLWLELGCPEQARSQLEEIEPSN
jgi:prophage regulatory protein